MSNEQSLMIREYYVELTAAKARIATLERRVGVYREFHDDIQRSHSFSKSLFPDVSKLERCLRREIYFALTGCADRLRAIEESNDDPSRG